MSTRSGLHRPAGLGATTRAGLKPAIFITLVSVLAVVVAAIASAPFRSSTNVESLLFQMAPLLLVAAGQATVILIAGIDLSVGSMMSLATVLAASGSAFGNSAVAVVAVVLLVGAIGGLTNGLGVLSGVNPLVMTLATMAVFRGIALLVLGQPGGIVPIGLLTPLTSVYGHVPLPFVVALVAIVLLWFATAETRWGRSLYATGADERHAASAGLPVRRTIMTAYLVAGLFAALGGLALVARIYSGDPLVGDPFALDSITAALIGGIAVTGGRGSVLAVVPAVLLLSLTDNLLNLFGVFSYWQYVAKGVILIATLWAYHAAGSPSGLLAMARSGWRPREARAGQETKG
jgi:ribose transport system permease protein